MEQSVRLNKTKLRQLIKEEIKKYLLEQYKGYIAPVDLSNVTVKQAKSQFKNYKEFHNFRSFSSPINNFISNDINEEINYSESLDIVKKEISNKYFLENWQFQITTHANNIYVAIIIPRVDQNVLLIAKDMEAMGYFNSFSQIININGYPYVQTQFEPLFQDDISNEVRKMKRLYHVTLTKYIDSIKQKGLLPSSNNNKLDYPNRIYFIKGDVDPSHSIGLAVQLAQESGYNIKDYSVIIIDTNKLPDNINFYLDPNYEQGLYTDKSISSQTIIKIIPITQFANNLGINIK